MPFLSPELRIIAAALAIYRLAQLVALDDGPWYVLARLRLLVGTFDRHPEDRPARRFGWSELVSCVFCLGMWFALPAVVAVALPTWPGDAVLTWLGLAGAQTWLQGGRAQPGEYAPPDGSTDSISETQAGPEDGPEED